MEFFNYVGSFDHRASGQFFRGLIGGFVCASAVEQAAGGMAAAGAKAAVNAPAAASLLAEVSPVLINTFVRVTPQAAKVTGKAAASGFTDGVLTGFCDRNKSALSNTAAFSAGFVFGSRPTRGGAWRRASQS